MKKINPLYFAIALTGFVVMAFNSGFAQVPTPSISNVSSVTQIKVAGGTVLLAPKLLNKLNVLDWGLIVPGDTDRTHVNWTEETYAANGDSSPIIAVVKKDGAGNEGKFYVVYADGWLVLGTASASGLSAPVLVNQNIANYYQLAGKDILYLVETNGYVYSSTDGGQNWQADTGNASGNGFTNVVLDTFQNVYAYYSGGSAKILKQDAHATSWHALAGFPNGQNVTGIYADRRGYIYVSTYQNGIYCSKDTGNTFTLSNTNLQLGTTQMFCDDAFGNVYITGGGGNQLYRSADTGFTWTAIYLPITSIEKDPATTFIINSIDGDTVLTVSTIYGVFVSHDQGNSFQPINQGLHETQFNGFFKSPSGRLIETSNNGVFYANQSSNSFTNSFPVNGYQYAGPIYNDTLGNIYTNAYSYGGSFGVHASRFYKSTDYGASWQADTAGLSALNSPSVFGVDEYGNVHVAATGVNNFGVPWLYNKTPGGSFALDTLGIGNRISQYVSVNAFCSDDNGNLFMGDGGNASKLVCWRRPIGGGTWVLDTAGLPGFTVISYLTRDTSHNMLALAEGQIYYHSNGVWSNIPAPNITGPGYVVAISADNTGGVLAAITNQMGYGGNSVYCTHDFGLSWNYVGLYGTNVYALYSFGDTTYALSDMGIYALTCSGVVLGITEPVPTPAAVNLSLYPNPTQGECNAVFTLPTSSAKNKFEIADMSGRVLKTIPVVAGANTLNFTTNDFSRGIYLCVLRAGGEVLGVRRFVVVK